MICIGQKLVSKAEYSRQSSFSSFLRARLLVDVNWDDFIERRGDVSGAENKSGTLMVNLRRPLEAGAGVHRKRGMAFMIEKGMIALDLPFNWSGWDGLNEISK